MTKIILDSAIATDIYIYINDSWVTGKDKSVTWKVMTQIGKTCLYYGVQDATHKTHLPSQTPGTWKSLIVNSKGGMVTMLVDKERWIKTQQRIV